MPLRIQIAVAGALLASAATSAGAQMTQGFWQSPTIAGYGKMHFLPTAAYQPDPRQKYRIVFALTQAPKSPAEVNPSLDRVARTVNLYVAAGVPLKNLKLVAVAYGAATPISLDDAHYRAKFGVPNPNLPLIEKLRRANVDVAVCGQAVAEHDFQYDWVDSKVTVALSGLTTITTLEQKGYDLMPL